jgi:hypothetical protein
MNTIRTSLSTIVGASTVAVLALGAASAMTHAASISSHGGLDHAVEGHVERSQDVRRDLTKPDPDLGRLLRTAPAASSAQDETPMQQSVPADRAVARAVATSAPRSRAHLSKRDLRGRVVVAQDGTAVTVGLGRGVEAEVAVAGVTSIRIDSAPCYCAL